MRSSPPLPLWSIATVRPSTSCSAFSSAAGVRILLRLGRAWRPWPRAFAGEALSLCAISRPRRTLSALVEDALGHLDRILHRQQRAAMARGELSPISILRTPTGRSVRRSVLAMWLRLLPMTLREVFLRVGELGHQARIALRLLDGD